MHAWTRLTRAQNEVDPTLCVTCSKDSTCTVWNIETQAPKTQLIAHDKEVYDVAWSPNGGTSVFSTVGADGSVRMFDLRSLEHSTIIYECPPISRLAAERDKANGGSGKRTQ